MASSYVVKDAEGNVIEGAVISRQPSADVLARKAARSAVGLSDRGRIPETVVGLAEGNISASDLAANIESMRVACTRCGFGLTDTENSAVLGVVDAKVKCIGIYNAMQAQNITLADLSAGADDSTDETDETDTE